MFIPDYFVLSAFMDVNRELVSTVLPYCIAVSSNF